ncbi:MAG: hypothetical protein J5I94_23590 [Phaeodactylibacter sp.]|nr:hypothetical protein [Phaeodactylibacter sp.]
MRRLKLFSGLIFLCFLFLGSVNGQEYYKFKFTCSDDSGTTSSDWMDERISDKMTLENRIYLSCHSLTLTLYPNDGDFETNSTVAKRNMHLWREYAVIGDDPNAPIVWRETSDYGEPDEVQYVTDALRPGSPRRYMSFVWNSSWHDGFWCVLYRYRDSDKRFRVKVRYVDQEGHEHWFYGIPAPAMDGY